MNSVFAKWGRKGKLKYLRTFGKSPRSTASKYFFSSMVNAFGKLGATIRTWSLILGGTGDLICNPKTQFSLFELDTFHSGSFLGFVAWKSHNHLPHPGPPTWFRSFSVYNFKEGDKTLRTIEFPLHNSKFKTSHQAPPLSLKFKLQLHFMCNAHINHQKLQHDLPRPGYCSNKTQFPLLSPANWLSKSPISAIKRLIEILWKWEIKIKPVYFLSRFSARARLLICPGWSVALKVLVPIGDSD